MKFMRSLVTRATEAKAATFTDQMATGEHTYGSGYPAGTWPEKGVEGDKVEGDKEKGDWTFKDGAWVNDSTGEVFDWGDKEKDPGEKKEGDFGNAEDWASWDKDDSAKALAASFMATIAASMSMF